MVGQIPTLWGWQTGAILGSITFTAVVTFWVLASASKIRDVLGETGIRSWCASWACCSSSLPCSILSMESKIYG